MADSNIRPHDGGDMPVAGDVFIEPVYRGPENPSKGIRRKFGQAKQFAWHWYGEDDDIVGYYA